MLRPAVVRRHGNELRKQVGAQLRNHHIRRTAIEVVLNKSSARSTRVNDGEARDRSVEHDRVGPSCLVEHQRAVTRGRLSPLRRCHSRSSMNSWQSSRFRRLRRRDIGCVNAVYLHGESGRIDEDVVVPAIRRVPLRYRNRNHPCGSLSDSVSIFRTLSTAISPRTIILDVEAPWPTLISWPSRSRRRESVTVWTTWTH